MTGIISLYQLCQLGIAEAHLWSDKLASDALALELGAAQRFAVIGTHALDTISELWESRLPSIPSDSSTNVPRAHDSCGEFLAELRREATELNLATDPDLDPSTRRMCQRIVFEVDLLIEEAARLGVQL